LVAGVAVSDAVETAVGVWGARAAAAWELASGAVTAEACTLPTSEVRSWESCEGDPSPLTAFSASAKTVVVAGCAGLAVAVPLVWIVLGSTGVVAGLAAVVLVCAVLPVCAGVPVFVAVGVVASATTAAVTSVAVVASEGATCCWTDVVIAEA